MNLQTVIRAWRDPIFRSRLPRATLLELPSHPAGGSVEDETDWSVQLGAITLGGGCGTAGCSKVACSDPCQTVGISCPNTGSHKTPCTNFVVDCP